MEYEKCDFHFFFQIFILVLFIVFMQRNLVDRPGANIHPKEEKQLRKLNKTQNVLNNNRAACIQCEFATFVCTLMISCKIFMCNSWACLSSKRPNVSAMYIPNE